MTNIEERPGAASKELERIASDTIPIYDENGAIEPDFLADVTAAIEAGIRPWWARWPDACTKPISDDRGLSRGEFAMRRFMILNGVARFAQFTRMAFVMVVRRATERKFWHLWEAESRATGVTCTMIAEAPEIAAIKRNRGLGDVTPITEHDLWAHIAENTSAKPYKELAIDLIGTARRDRENAIDFFIRASHRIQRLALSAVEIGRALRDRIKAEAVRSALVATFPRWTAPSPPIAAMAV